MRIKARIGGKCRVRYENIASADISHGFKTIAENEIELDLARDEAVTITLL
jgi:hypothetical protein